MKLKKLFLTIFAGSIFISGCVSPKNDTLPEFGDVIIATSDYSTGALSTLYSDYMTSANNILIGSIDSDAYVRSCNEMIYVLNNTNSNIQLINPLTWTTSAQESTGAYSYPHDLAVNGSVAYVTLNGSSNLLILNAATLKTVGSIDLSSFNASGATNPGADRLYFDSLHSNLYVSLQRFNSSWTIDYSAIVVISTVDYSIKKSIQLKWTSGSSTVYARNPLGKFVYASSSAWNNGDGNDHLFILCAGLYDASYSDLHDGGIVAIDMNDLEVENGYLVSESRLGEAITDFEFKNKFYVSSNSSGASIVSSMLPQSESLRTIMLTAGSTYKIPSLKINSTGFLLAADRTATMPGIWMFNTNNNDALMNSQPVSTGLPPVDITCIR